MKSFWSYLIATVTLPVNIPALVTPCMLVPLWAAMASTGTEINGTRITMDSTAILPVAAYLLVLSVSWISGVNRNGFDRELRLLSMGNSRIRVLLLPYAFHCCFGLVCGVVAIAELLALGGQPSLLDPGMPLLVMVEFAAISLFGCAIGQVTDNGAVAVSAIVLYSILLEPAVERLAPFITERGIAGRIQEAHGGTLPTASLLIDIAFFLSVSFLLFLTTLAIDTRKSKNA